MKFTNEQIEHARATQIHYLLGVQKNRRRITMSCPFPDHNDSTASFSLYDDNSYRCYGCDTWGNNAVDFLQHMGFKFNQIIEEYG